MAFIKPIMTAPTDFVMDEDTGVVLQAVEHYAQGDSRYRIVRNFGVVVTPEDENQNPQRTFSKYKLVGALMAAKVWPQVKAWIESVPGAYDLYLAAEDISEDEPLLAQGIAAVKELLGWTDAQVEEVLAASVREGA